MKALRIHPATILFFLILIITGYSSVILSYVLAVILHELGHAFVAKKLGYTLDRIWILPFGACLSFEEFSFDPKDEIKIAFAGPVVNIILILTVMTMWWINPITYIYTYTFTLANFSLAFFNLLPIYPLDGGRVLTGILRLNYKTKKAFKLACILNYVFSFIFLLLFIVSIFIGINFNFGLIAVFLFVSTFEGRFQGKYSPILYQYSNKKGLKPMGVKNLCVTSSTPFYKVLPEINKHKYNLIYVLYPNQSLKLVTEKQFQTILEKYSMKNCFHDLYNKKDFD